MQTVARLYSQHMGGPGARKVSSHLEREPRQILILSLPHQRRLLREQPPPQVPELRSTLPDLQSPRVDSPTMTICFPTIGNPPQGLEDPILMPISLLPRPMRMNENVNESRELRWNNERRN